ncbi:hypothetical protein CLAFUW4_04043 [Fulvia fulva]|nr:hypothetical protein CLAFUR4_04029 [Fulvia fulva]WPV13734.1 hypothetical protein CLAFUW4_04043 [Fulvia fulva]WPV29197.1 hypothetical protein CLAFUW7_04032 [Fulvia fulva]
MASASAAPDIRGQADAAENARRADVHEKDVGEREAYEYWGYLFKPDKTGTDKLKSLLRGLKDAMNAKYEPSDQPDLTPSQLASFYRDLHGNYDQLFLGTPNESIAFIYKSLGCLHSLQPPAYTHASAFTDPTVPALKTEGWIMWQTIQLLLGPEEHAAFLREAVQIFDVKDHDTGEAFPKILPRQCFPLEPDKHMVAWYEGVSERLRREAEDEEKHKQIEVEHEPEVRRLHSREQPPRREGEVFSDEEGSVDSRGPALAYFRNPLYRYVDGRPSIVRSHSKRPALSPRPTVLGKGKEAASTFSRIARNVGSPHLWDGRGSSRSRDREGAHVRRKSHPDNYYHHHADEAAAAVAGAGAHDSRHPPREPSGHGSQRRRRSSQADRPPERTSPGTSADDEWDQSEASPIYSPPPGKGSDSSRHRRGHSHSTSRPVSRDEREMPLRHSKSHEPTPSQELDGDYFAGYDDPARRRNSTHAKPDSPPSQPPPQPTGPALGPSFGPSAGPLFAAQVAKQPHPPAQHYSQAPPGGGYEGGPSMRNPSVRRAQGQDRYQSRSPEPGSRPPPPREPRDPRDHRDRRYDSPGRPPPGRHDSPLPYDDFRPDSRGPPPRPESRNRYDDAPPPRDPRDRDPRDRDPRDRDPRDRDSRNRDPRDRDPRDRDLRDRDPRDHRRGSARMSQSDFEREEYPDERRGSRPGPPPKHARFADTGVSGRKYPDEAGWP